MTIIRAGLLVLACLVLPVQAEENCSGWRTADVDPTKEKFELELRTCELPYGLSAYVQIRNSSENRVALSYRLMLKDRTSKDNDTVLNPGAMVRTETCQACAKRYAGLDSWQIISAKSLGKPEAEPTVSSVEPHTASAAVVTPIHAAPMQSVQKESEEKPIASVKAQEVAASVAPPKIVAPVAPPRAVESSSADTSRATTPAKVDQPKVAAKKPTEQDGFRAEDGTIIPWSQLPPEFRPRK